MKKWMILFALASVLNVQALKVHGQDETTIETTVTEEKEPGFEEKETSTKQVVEEVSIPFATQRRKNPNLAPGEEVIIQQGVAGLRKVLYTYETSLAGDKLIKTDYLEVIQEPVDQIVEFGPEVTSQDNQSSEGTETETSNTEKESQSSTEAENSTTTTSSNNLANNLGSRNSKQATIQTTVSKKQNKKFNEKQSSEKANKTEKSTKNTSESHLPEAGESPILFGIASLMMMCGLLLFIRTKKVWKTEKVKWFDE